MLQAPLPIGTCLRNGNYRIERLLGVGGFGYVYCAVDPGGVHYAVKEAFDKNQVSRANNCLDVVPKVGKTGGVQIHEHQCMRAREEAHRFKQPQLKHPNLVPILGWFDQFGTTFIVMPLIEGKTLGDALAIHEAQEIWWQLSVLSQIAEALEVLHRSSLIHRDLKPDNVLISQQNGRPVPVLLDMGAAREYTDSKNLHTGIATDFGAPEIVSDFEARTYGKPSPATDCFALAGIAFLMLSGVNPVGYAARVTMRKRNSIDPLGRPPRLSQAAWLVLQRSLTLETASRHFSARELVNDLTKALENGTKGVEKPEVDETPGVLKYDPIEVENTIEPHQSSSDMVDWIASGIAISAVCLLLILMAGLQTGVLFCLVFLFVHLVIAVFAIRRHVSAALAMLPIVNLWVCFNTPISDSKKL